MVTTVPINRLSKSLIVGLATGCKSEAQRGW